MLILQPALDINRKDFHGEADHPSGFPNNNPERVKYTG